MGTIDDGSDYDYVFALRILSMPDYSGWDFGADLSLSDSRGF